MIWQEVERDFLQENVCINKSSQVKDSFDGQNVFENSSCWIYCGIFLCVLFEKEV